MTPFFADAFYFIAVLNPDDEWHELAWEFADRYNPEIVTTRAVLLELADGMASPVFREAAAEYLRFMEIDPSVEVLPLDDDLWGRGLERYENRPDKAWSLTDCISFVAMEDRGITDALTGDKHFEQAGFNVLLKRED